MSIFKGVFYCEPLKKLIFLKFIFLEEYALENVRIRAYIQIPENSKIIAV